MFTAIMIDPGFSFLFVLNVFWESKVLTILLKRTVITQVDSYN